MSQAGFEPLVHSDTSYEADALHPSHHGWITVLDFVSTSLAFTQIVLYVMCNFLQKYNNSDIHGCKLINSSCVNILKLTLIDLELNLQTSLSRLLSKQNKLGKFSCCAKNWFSMDLIEKHATGSDPS